MSLCFVIVWFQILSLETLIFARTFDFSQTFSKLVFPSHGSSYVATAVGLFHHSLMKRLISYHIYKSTWLTFSLS